MKEIFRRKPLDKDLFFSRDGDLYQAITSVHPLERVVALRKYHYNPKKPKGVFAWQSPQFPGYFTRSIPTYNVKDATTNIEKSNYNRVSKVFNVPMIEVPWEQITAYLYPDQGLQDWLLHKSETEWGRDIADVVTQFKNYLCIEDTSMGITGSLLWGGQHAGSDIDIVIYGIENTQRFIRNVGSLLKQSTSIHTPPPEFIERYANTLAKKTGLKLDLTRQYIAKKPYYLFYKNKFLSLGFVPAPEEVSHTYEAYSFRTLVPIKVIARILDDRSGYFYPGEYRIDPEVVAIKGTSKEVPPVEEVAKNLTTILLMEREISGYYVPGDMVEIQGMLQAVRDGSQNYLQVMVGTQELYGSEWVKLQHQSQSF